MSMWMQLFTASAAAFAADAMGQSNAQTEMESARAAFVMLFLNVCGSHDVLPRSCARSRPEVGRRSTSTAATPMLLAKHAQDSEPVSPRA